jgi:hypothetical protein
LLVRKSMTSVTSFWLAWVLIQLTLNLYEPHSKHVSLIEYFSHRKDMIRLIYKDNFSLHVRKGMEAVSRGKGSNIGKLACTQPKIQNQVGRGRNKSYLRIRRGSCRKAGDRRIGAGPPNWGPGLAFLPPLSNGGGPPWSLNMRIATSGGAGTKGPSGLQVQQAIRTSS